MTTDAETVPDFVWELFRQLRRRKFPLGPEDLEALRRALKMGFGLRSRDALRRLFRHLWAKSRKDEAVIDALFGQMDLPHWEIPDVEESETGPDALTAAPGNSGVFPETRKSEPPPVTRPFTGLPEIRLPVLLVTDYPFSFVPLYPLTYRETAQSWQRLRKPVREGPPVEIDVDATIARRCRTAVVTPVVLVPRRRNTARLLVFVDRNGSMTPYHRYAAEVCDAIRHSGSPGCVRVFYFHNLPVESTDRDLLDDAGSDPFPDPDRFLDRISPRTEGFVYSDEGLLFPRSLKKVLEDSAGAALAVISDAGAARNRMRNLRLIDTLAFLKGIRNHTRRYVWLNPVPTEQWGNSTARQIARYVPMFPMTVRGLHRAVDVLKGRPFSLESRI